MKDTDLEAAGAEGAETEGVETEGVETEGVETGPVPGRGWRPFGALKNFWKIFMPASNVPYPVIKIPSCKKYSRAI